MSDDHNEEKPEKDLGMSEKDSGNKYYSRLPKSVFDNAIMAQRALYQSIELIKPAQYLRDSIEESMAKMLPKVSVLQDDTLSELQTKILESVKSTVEIQEAISPALMEFAGAMSQISKLYTPQIPVGYFSEYLASNIAESMVGIQEALRSISEIIESPALQWFRSFDYSAIMQQWLIGLNIKLDTDIFNRLYLDCMYEAHWSPNAIMCGDISLAVEVGEVLEHTRDKEGGFSKTRIKKIDKVIFEYYSKAKINELKKRMLSGDIPQHVKRMIRDSINAYYRKEYATTTIVLSTQWESIICKKANDCAEWRVNKRIQKDFHELVRENEDDYPEIFESFFDDFIAYDVRSAEKNKDDVPGRNSSAHGFFDKYPTRKAALNAILFTDFLTELRPISVIHKMPESQNEG